MKWWPLGGRPTAMTMEPTVHIGNEIHRVMLEQGRSVAWLAREYGCSRIHMYRLFDKASLDTQVVMRFSLLLGYDFFALLQRDYERRLAARNLL